MQAAEPQTSECCSPVRKETSGAKDTQTVSVARIAGHVNAVDNEHALSLLTSSAKIEFKTMPIPGGKAMIGTDAPQIPVDEEAPIRTASLRPYWMDAFTVTNARFAAFVAATGYKTEAEKLGDSFVFQGFLPDSGRGFQSVVAAPWWRMVPGANWRQPLGRAIDAAPEADHPVVHVSWNDAEAFAKWAGGRLPTEAEWEHAARGGLGNVMFPWGNQAPDETSYFPCNIWQGQFPKDNSALDGYVGTAPVDAFQPNGFGLYNMVGNVWEWTAQPFKIRSLKKDIKMAHQGKTGFKIVKGGSFLCHVSYCYRYRIAARTGNSPDSSTSHTGFRLVYDKDPALSRAG